MKTPAFLLFLSMFASGFASAESVFDLSGTKVNTLNDLVREVPAISPAWERRLRRLSAIQEQLYLFEERMRGRGLPAEFAGPFSENYSAILGALVEDRLLEEDGRELLSIHRQPLGRTEQWLAKRVRDEGYPEKLVENLAYFRKELRRRSVPPKENTDSLRTPVINGFQAWVGELVAWGEEVGGLSPGMLARVRTRSGELERLERRYKADGALTRSELESLHARFLKLSRDTIEAIAR